MSPSIRRYLAQQWFNCSECEELIEPDDLMGRARPFGPPLCEVCVELFDDPDEDS